MNNHRSYIKTSQNIKIAYIHAISFPSTEANTFDAMWSASALSEEVDTTFFMPRLKSPKSRLKDYYEISGSALKLQSMHLNLIPDRFLLRYKSTYENFLSQYFRFHPQWVGFEGKKVLYAREPKELLYWGLRRKKLSWMKDWIFCYEAHDCLGLDPNLFERTNQISSDNLPVSSLERDTLAAAINFDLMICNTKILADDMRYWSRNTLQPQFLLLASPLPRLSSPPQIRFGEKIIIGYIGTVDKFRGVDILLDAIRFLPPNYSLRIVGRFRQENGVDSNWLEKYTEDPNLRNRLDINLVDQITDVAAEIDRCDIMVQPASSNILDSRYAAPLKSYGYMVRGKPIVAGDVLCHRELFENGEDAILYQLTPEHLAASILCLGENNDLAERIARGAWLKGENFTFDRKVADLLNMIESVREKRLI